MKRVYISGPITKGNRSHNFYQAAEAQRMLLEVGYAVLNPMLSMAHMDGHNISWEMWIASDLAFIEVCDLIVRLPGESKGADLEVAHARHRGIPVVCTSMEAMQHCHARGALANAISQAEQLQATECQSP